MQTEVGSNTEVSYACDSVPQLDTDVPRPGDDGYSQLPMDSTAATYAGDVGGNLLDVMA